MEASLTVQKILAIDIGGTHIKAAVLTSKGEIIQEYEFVKTPRKANFISVTGSIKKLVKDFKNFDVISVGFPGFVKEGVVITAPNLQEESWRSVDLVKEIHQLFQKPVRVINDADMLGLGVSKGKGFEILITLGTGFGTAFLKDGLLLPHIELAHHPLSKKYTYDEYLGARAFEKFGPVKWNKRVEKIITVLKTVFNYDALYIGGGNAKNINIMHDENISIVSNRDGISGGAKLWRNSSIFL